MNIPEIKGPNGEIYTDFIFYNKGGMGEIYKGVEFKSKQEIILKLIIIKDLSDEKLLMRELNVSTKFSSPNVVAAKITGKIEIRGNNYLYMILDFYENGNMKNLIKDNIPIQECYSMMQDILNGMKEVHSFVVHRDLKPENILVGSDGELLITDFGLAKYIDETTKTKSFKGAGTIPYMAPECWTGDKNTISMDIYALGLIFFEIIIGKRAFQATTEMEWRNCHLFSSIPDISSLRSDINIKIKQIIQKMTNKRVEDRYTNIDEIIKSLNGAVTLDEKEKKDADRLALMGNMVIQQKKTKALEKTKEQERINELKNSLKFNIEELFSKFVDKANDINDRLEEEKIIIKKNIDGNNTETKKLELYFNSKGIKITFTAYNAVTLNENEMNEKSRNFQRERYGGILQQPQQSFFVKNDIVLIGLAETTYKIGNVEYGFNLLLKKQPNSQYGDWYMMQFSENITPPKTSFALDINSFFSAYNEFEHHPMFTGKFQKLEENDVVTLIAKIML